MPTYFDPYFFRHAAVCRVGLSLLCQRTLTVCLSCLPAPQPYCRDALQGLRKQERHCAAATVAAQVQIRHLQDIQSPATIILETPRSTRHGNSPRVAPPGGEANDSAAPSPDDDGWAPWPSDRGLTKDEYKKVVDERLRIFYLGVFEFHTDIHRLYTAGEWKSLESAISMMKYHFVKTVDWDTLDAETQEGLTRWAPKAKEYLETVPGSQSR